LSSSGAPAGVTANFTPASLAAPGSGNTVLTLTATAAATLGAGTINVIGTAANGTTVNSAVAVNVTAASTGLLVNPGFETGTFSGWTTGGAIAPTISTAQKHSGKYSALLGSTKAPEVNGDSYVKQTVTLPSVINSITLGFYYYPGTTDTITYAYQEALIQSTTGTTLATVLKVASNARGWKQATFDLTSYAGQTIVLYFAAHGNGYAKDEVYMYLDDVSITTT